MRIVFLGGGEISVPSLKRLIDDGHEILAVVCQPDKPNARGNKIEMLPVKKFAISKNIPVLQFTKIREDGVLPLKELNPDLMVVVAYGQILSQEVIDLPKFGTINVHASLLPKYRGSSPIISAVLSGEETTGVTIMRIAKEVDSGNIFLKDETKILENETAGELSERLAELGANLLSKVVVEIENGTAKEEPQDHSQATFTKMIRKEDGLIDFSKTAKEIKNQVRAFNPAPVAYVERNGEKIKVFEAEIVPADETVKNGEVICSNNKEGIVVKCGKDALKILKLQAPGGKAMDWKSYLNGRKF